MAMLQELLSTDVGLLSLFCIIFMLVMSWWLYRYFSKRIQEDTIAKRERDKQRAAAAAAASRKS